MLWFSDFIGKYPPYSDFNFYSFYSWDTDSKHQVSQYNGNLVLRFADYVTGELCFSILGSCDIDRSIEGVLALAEQYRIKPILKLVPEATMNALRDESQFSVTEDVDNFDYIFSLKNLAELQGKQYKSKRRSANKCSELFDITISDASNDLQIEETIIQFLKKWENSKIKNGKEVDMYHELKAISRILHVLPKQDTLRLTVATYKNIVVGFSIDELLPSKYVMSHYCKALPEITGLSDYLNQEVAKILYKAGYHKWNWEQDLGIESLRTMKLSHRPIEKLKKYIVSKN
jgi:hypothetical protein